MNIEMDIDRPHERELGRFRSADKAMGDGECRREQ